MKTRNVCLVLLVCLCVALAAVAADANMGKWKLNEAKSKIAAGQGKNTMVVYEAAGNKVKVIVDGVDAAGKPTHNEWTGMFDGKDYPVMGDPNSDARAYTRVNDRTLSLVVKKAGKVTGTVTIKLAADGKSRTLTQEMTDTSGKKITSTLVYDKQ